MNYLVYDLDGTLVISSRQIDQEMIDVLTSLKEKGYKNIIVSGGCYEKIKWQLTNRFDLFDMIFSESGAILHINDKLIYKKNIVNLIDSKLLNKINLTFYNFCNEI